MPKENQCEKIEDEEMEKDMLGKYPPRKDGITILISDKTISGKSISRVRGALLSNLGAPLPNSHSFLRCGGSIGCDTAGSLRPLRNVRLGAST